MDELKLFSSLRPEEPPLFESERAALRTAVFRTESAESGESPGREQTRSAADTSGVDFELDVPRRDGREASTTEGFAAGGRRRVLLAAAAVVALGLGGLWAATSLRNGNEPSTPAQSPDPDSACTTASATTRRPASTDSPGDYRLPRVTIDQPGWALARGSDASSAGPDLVVFDPACRFNGPSVSVLALDPGSGLSLQDGEHEVAVGAVTGELSASGDETWLTWTDAADKSWWARGWRVDEATVTAVANAVTTDQSGAATLSSVPHGFELADPAATAALGVSSQYEFQRDDGATIEISFYPGGAAAVAERVSDESDRSTVPLGDEEVSLLDYGDGGRYRADLKRGFWVWELDGEPFDSPDDFLALVSALRVVDEETWRATLPDNIVAGGAERAAAVEQLLAGVPVPAGFDVGGTQLTADRYQLITQVSGAVACAWLDQWFDATEAGDDAAATAAADALATSHQWPMLREIETQGAWSESLWDTADAVNGGSGGATGTGPEAPTRADTAGGLGCRSR